MEALALKRKGLGIGRLWYPVMNIALGIVIARAVIVMLQRGPGSEFMFGVMLSIACLGVVAATLAYRER
jgi:hypothetical protein